MMSKSKDFYTRLRISKSRIFLNFSIRETVAVILLVGKTKISAISTRQDSVKLFPYMALFITFQIRENLPVLNMRNNIKVGKILARKI